MRKKSINSKKRRKAAFVTSMKRTKIKWNDDDFNGDDFVN